MPKSAEFRQKMLEGWATARANKDERRRQNRERWAKRRDWASDHEVETAVVLEIPAETETGSGSLAKMRAIMADPKTPLHRRLDAAECVLTFELGPGGVVGLDVGEIAASSYRFLRAAAEAAETPENLKFRALRALTAVENARISARTAVQNTENQLEKRELARAILNGERRRQLIELGLWPPGNDNWMIPKEAVADRSYSWSWPPQDFGTLLERGEVSDEFLLGLELGIL